MKFWTLVSFLASIINADGFVFGQVQGKTDTILKAVQHDTTGARTASYT
jgi:hypothetical protein